VRLLDQSLKRESQQTPALAGRRQRNFSRLLGALNRHYPISAFFVVSLFYRRFVAFSLVPLQIFSVYVLIFRFSALSFGLILNCTGEAFSSASMMRRKARQPQALALLCSPF
jgi:hypothetical protein